MELRRFNTLPDPATVVGLLEDDRDLQNLSEPCGFDADLEEAVQQARALVDEGSPRTGSEAQLARPIFLAMSGLPNRLLNDVGMWAWLAVGPFSGFAVYRWLNGNLPEPEDLTSATYKRFVPAAASLNGFSRHAIARIFWAARTLYTPEEEFDLVDVVLGNQDFYQAIFERLLVLYPPVARACARVLRDAGEDERRLTLVRLNLVLSTIVVESLEEAEIEALVSELHSIEPVLSQYSSI